MKGLTDIRNQIDCIDDQMVKLYIDRLSLCGQVAKYKKNNGVAVENKERERQIIDRLVGGLDKEQAKLVTVLYETIFSLSKEYQKKLMEENK